MNNSILLIGAGALFLFAGKNSSSNIVNAGASPNPVTTTDVNGNINTVPQVMSNVMGVMTPQTTDITRQVQKSTGAQVITYTAGLPAYTGSASYDVISGTGYSSGGAGYSSAFNLGSSGTSGVTTSNSASGNSGTTTTYANGSFTVSNLLSSSQANYYNNLYK